MRRSAAPSQVQKRLQGQFVPPFGTPAAKRINVGKGESDVTSTSSVATATSNKNTDEIPIRSPSDILSLLKKQSVSLGEMVGSAKSTKDEELFNDSNVVINSSYALKTLSPSNISKHNEHIGSTRHHAMSPRPGMENQQPQQVRYYSVVWCKRSNKKHKKWEGDAVLITKGRTVVLKDTEGKDIGQSSGYRLVDLASLEEGNTLPVGGKEVEIQGIISAEDYSSGKCFQSNVAPVVCETPTPLLVGRCKPKPFRLPTRNPLCASSSPLNAPHAGPLYDPTSPDAIVMPRPPSQHQWRYNKEKSAVLDVVLDPHVGRQLRPHQIEGVIFLFECVMGYKFSDHFGAILADEMGLGKTLQCIALVWTLLKQGPYGRRPVITRVLIVTPSSLTANWGKEFKKWLGKERVGIYIVDQNNKVEHYGQHKEKPIMIISYEMFMRYADVIESLKFDLLLCDEGHRLKNANIKTNNLLTTLKCQKRIILTGTPVQNDLKELYALVEFVNPGVIGSSTSYRHVYEEPILASQQPGASEAERELGATRASQLNRMTSMFTLRRTQDVINRYLPPKVEYVVFCQPSETQLSVYNDIIGCRSIRQIFHSMDASDHLSAILLLRKLCNHPALLTQNSDVEGCSELAKEVAKLLPDHIHPMKFEESDSGKLAVLSCILWALNEHGNEKIVIVSNYTTTLDMLAQLCDKYNYCYLRLDGSTPTSKRQDLVDQFNMASSRARIFLLSAKAGGVGLNLVGASRILLYDIDWNPATDLQAMARVWRDGQRKKVHIYRLLMTGSLDEKIFQRQIKKQGLSGAVVDARDSQKAHFSTSELKDLFTVHGETSCLTHDLLKCNCDLSGNISSRSPVQKESQLERACQLSTSGSTSSMSNTTMDQLQNWCHLGQPFNLDIVQDHCLEAASDFITFLFRNESSS